MEAGGGGRVTELTARPLLNLFYPELSGVVQPLAGEYAGRREALERVPFFSGYGVETGLLIDIYERYGLNAIAQVDLLDRIHHNQRLEALSKMSFAIIQTIFRKLENCFGSAVLEDVNRSMKLICYNNKGYFLEVEEIAERERPPMIEGDEYQARFKAREAALETTIRFNRHFVLCKNRVVVSATSTADALSVLEQKSKKSLCRMRRYHPAWPGISGGSPSARAEANAPRNPPQNKTC